MNDYEKELDNLKSTIAQLKSDIKVKDEIIQRQNDEKVKIDKRVQELEKMLASFLVKYDE